MTPRLRLLVPLLTLCIAILAFLAPEAPAQPTPSRPMGQAMQRKIPKHKGPVATDAMNKAGDDEDLTEADLEEWAATLQKYPYRIPEKTVIGRPSWYVVKENDTLLDVARMFGLGWNEIEQLYPKLDPWVPQRGLRLMMPTLWVLPPTRHEDLVINLPELRLYFFDKKGGTVQTYPIGIGDEGWETPVGVFSIKSKRENPTWYLPASLQEKYGMKSMPPGPANPLGEFFMGFSDRAYGLHGTAMPWGVGRLVSHGCIRTYPEHTRLLYPQVRIGMRIEIMYEPVKVGQDGEQVYVEVHPDVYRRIPDFERYAEDKMRAHPLAARVDWARFQNAVRLQNGVPTNVTRYDFMREPVGSPAPAK